MIFFLRQIDIELNSYYGKKIYFPNLIHAGHTILIGRIPRIKDYLWKIETLQNFQRKILDL